MCFSVEDIGIQWDQRLIREQQVLWCVGTNNTINNNNNNNIQLPTHHTLASYQVLEGLCQEEAFLVVDGGRIFGSHILEAMVAP